ncbi:MAG: class IV adenylate cyclase [Peptoniphilaceae bacterium]|nr:class IV adenylate cyclase [Peptoniphilaceae bacterium]MDD7383010.1 class IV adenylate cyclase [Peptoniphilaceae bacterium]
MEKELEIKVLNIDVEEIEKKLIHLNALKIGEEFQTNYTFESENINEGSYLRIRKTKIGINEKPIELTFKERVKNLKIRQYNEYTVHIDNVDNMISILKFLNVDLKYIGKKKRISYKLKNARIDIDIWDKETYPLPYLEIEVSNEDDINEIINILNINRDNITKKSISELRDEL